MSSKTPVMSTIKGWFRLMFEVDDTALGHVLTGFSLGVWIGSLHPEMREKLGDEMADQTFAHDELIKSLFKEIYPDD